MASLPSKDTIPAEEVEIKVENFSFSDQECEENARNAEEDPEALLAIQWNNFNSNVQDSLGDLKQKEKFSDVTLACDGNLYPAHKFVLSMCSGYFEKILDSMEEKLSVIVLLNIESKILESLLSFMYHGKVKIERNDLGKFMVAAENLHIKGLKAPEEHYTLNFRKRSPSSSGISNSSAKRKRSSSIQAKVSRKNTKHSEIHPNNPSTIAHSSQGLTEGHSSHALTEGPSSHTLTEGQSSHVWTEGPSSHFLTEGPSSHFLTEGTSSHAWTEGHSSHFLTEGHSSRYSTEDGSSDPVTGAHSGSRAAGTAPQCPAKQQTEEEMLLNTFSSGVHGSGGVDFLFYDANAEEEEEELCGDQLAGKESSYVTQWPAKGFSLNVNAMPNSLKETLERNFPLDISMQRRLLAFLYDQMTRYGFYFRKSQVYEVVYALLDSYPHLIHHNMSKLQSVECWKKRLNQKLSNMRKRHARDDPQVQARIKSANKVFKSSSQPLPQTPGTSYSYCNFSEESGNREEKKHFFPEANEAVTDSFGERRKLILSKKMSIPELIEKFPSIFSANQILMDFKRLTGIDLEQTLKEKILTAKAHLTDPGDLMYGSVVSEEEVVFAAVKNIPLLFREELQLTAPPTDSHPHLQFEGGEVTHSSTAKLLVEETVVCSCSGFLRATAVWFAAFYVFNRPFDRRLINTLTFIQRGLLGLPEGTDIPVKVLALMNKIQQ